MARLSIDQAKDLTSYGSEWFKLASGETAVIQFFGKNDQDIDIFATHRLNDGKYDRNVHCLREYDDPISMCPLCQAGIKAEATIMLAMIDPKTQKVLVWQRGKGRGGAFLSKLQSIFNRYQPVQEKLFCVERFGEGLDTTYDIFRYEGDNVPVLDVSKLEKPNFDNIVLRLTDTEMFEYIETGKLPQKETPQAQSSDSRGSRRQQQQEEPSRFSRRR